MTSLSDIIGNITACVYDAVGRLVASNLKSWNDGGSEPAGDSLEHCYAGSRHIQNFDGSSTYGARWHWAGAQNDHGAPLRAPSADSSAQQTYYTPSAGGAGDPQRRTFLNPTTEGDKRELFAQGRPEAKDSSGAGANWYLGTQSAPQTGGQNTVESRFFFTGTVASNATIADLSRSTDKREKDRMGVFGTSNSYAGSYGRVTSEPIGRDLNPLGRGSGQAFVAGELNLGSIAPHLAGSRNVKGTGNSINNSYATPSVLKACCSCCNYVHSCSGLTDYLAPSVGESRDWTDKCCVTECSSAFQRRCVGDGGLVRCPTPPFRSFTCNLYGSTMCSNIPSGFEIPDRNKPVSVSAKGIAKKCLENYKQILNCKKGILLMAAADDPIGHGYYLPKWEEYSAKQALTQCMIEALDNATFQYYYGNPLDYANKCCDPMKPSPDTCCTPGDLAVSCPNSSKILICPRFLNFCMAAPSIPGTSIGFAQVCCFASVLMHEIMHKCGGTHIKQQYGPSSPMDLIVTEVMSCCGCPTESMFWWIGGYR